MSETKPKRPRCHNCQFAGEGFKVGDMTHHHCYGPQYPKDQLEAGEISPWETLREFYSTCEDHQFNQPVTEATAQ